VRAIRIGGDLVGPGHPCYIIAEAGSNHNGDLDMAFRLVDVAAEAGANAVKFQHFKAKTLYPKSAGSSDYLGSPRPIYEIIQEMEMPDRWVPLLAERCGEKGVSFLSSPFDETAVDWLDRFVPAYKVASYEISHVPLLRHIARKGKPVILSTGTADLSEVLEAVGLICAEGNDRIVLLQCTASYPAPLDAVNVRAIVTMRERTGLCVGLSDHSRDPVVAPMAAVALGAAIVEKHFTLDRSLPGPDHRFAIEPDELREMVRRIREVEQALGDGRKERHPVEKELHDFARRCLFAVKPIAAGESLSPGNIAVLRRGKKGEGLPPSQYEAVMGRKAARFIPADSPLRLEDLE
jgi:N-acetylneuraminate synthase